MNKIKNKNYEINENNMKSTGDKSRNLPDTHKT